MPNIPATISICTRFASATLRERKIRSGTSGCAARRLAGDEAGQQGDRDGAEAERVAPSPSRCSAPRRSCRRRASARRRSGARPGRRRRGRGRCRPRGRAGARARSAVAIPIGRLTKKIQCQLIDCVSTPPASRPIEPPAAATNAEDADRLRLLVAARGNSVTIMPRITAEVSAPPTPWTKRAATSTPGSGPAPQSSDASVKSARPAEEERLRPMRSPRRPASSSSPPNAMR